MSDKDLIAQLTMINLNLKEENEMLKRANAWLEGQLAAFQVRQDKMLDGHEHREVVLHLTKDDLMRIDEMVRRSVK